MVPADSRRIPRVPRYSGYRYAWFGFVYRTVTFYDVTFQILPLAIAIQCRGPTTPPAPYDVDGLGCSPFARHYWGNHYLFSLPAGTKMFQFPALASWLRSGWPSFRRPGCPIRKSPDQRLFAPTRGLSQLITSFIASVSLGIRHTPFLTFLSNCA